MPRDRIAFERGHMDHQRDFAKFQQPGPRLHRNREHFDQCHDRWLDRRNRIPDDAHDPADWCHTQCGGCRFYVKLTGSFKSDWGACTNPLSPRDGLVTFEHDGCEKYAAADEGWS